MVSKTTTAILTALLLVFCITAFSQAEQTRTPRELRAAAGAAMSQGAFSEAIPIIDELIAALGGSKKEDIFRSMEVIYYKLGICYFFSAQFGESEKAFATYLKKYPKGFYLIDANVYTADGYRFLSDFDKALKKYDEILKKFDRLLSRSMRIDVMCSMARCHLAKDRWEIGRAHV